MEDKHKTKKQLINELAEMRQQIAKLEALKEGCSQKASGGLEIRVRERTAELVKANKELMAEINERKKIESALQEGESRFKKLSQEFNTLLDAIPDNLVLLSPDMKMMWVNKAAASAFGKDVSELTGLHCFSLCKDIFSPNDNYPAIKSFRTGKEETAELSTSDGRVWDVRAFPLKDDTGRVKNVIELARNITAKISMEKEAKLMQVKLIHANKMTAIGTLVSGVAHEINNPNSFILSNVQLISEIWKDAIHVLEKYYHKNGDFSLGGLRFSELQEVIPKLLGGINDGALKIKSIVDNLRDFARPGKANMDEKIDINKVITASRTILSNQIKKYTDNFNISRKKNIPIVRGNSQQIEQVLVNLLLNSLQALPNKNCGVWVSASFNEKSDYLVIQVRDEGIGMSKDVLERIMEPFFTTKLDSGGTGLGLSISYAIIKDHNGTLEFESESDKGTTATVKLPAYNQSKKLNPPSPTSPILTEGM